jgi:2-dehydro-3-deoxyphosphogluconate aldolase/(4S)-4-hydroxy-2-oxoglutarate aldolase
MVHSAVSAGADFIVSPILDPDLIDAARSLDAVVIPGAYTPTEAQRAWEAGADLVKIFPASALGPSYMKALLAPLPHLRLVPTGGVDLENARAFLEAGAFAVCLGSCLIDKEALRTGRYQGVLDRARRLVDIVNNSAKGDSE